MKLATRLFLSILSLSLLSTLSSAQGVSSSGTDYWLGFMPNGAMANYGGYDQLHLFIASGVDNQVQVSFAGEVRNIKIPANTVYDFDLPDIATTRDVEKPVDRAIHVTSVNPVTIYGYSVWWFPGGIGGSPDGYLALPTTSYGKKYLTVNYYSSQFGSAQTAAEFLVIAPQDNTQVTITTKGDTRVGSTVTHRAGETWTVVLMKGQTYLVQSDRTLAGDNDLTGSKVESDKPVAVITGHEITPIILGERTSADHLLEMMPPVERWGTQYFDMPMAGRTACGDYIRVLSAEDGNEITYNGKGPLHLDAGEWAERDLVVDPEVYTSTNHKKFIVMQYSYSQGYNGDPGTADPFMILMTAQEQFQKKMVFRTPTPAQAGTFNNYITFICVDTAIRKIKIDGKLITSYQFVGLQSFPATNPVMSAYRVKLPGGSRAYFAEGPAPFGAYQYGFSNYEGYGWPTGMAQRLITPDTLAPLSAVIDSGCGVFHVRYFEPRLKTNGFSFDDTKFAYLSLITADNDPRWPTPSYNIDFTDSNFTIGDSVTTATLRVQDLTQDAYGAVYAVDLAGNDTVFEYHYFAPKMSILPKPTYTFSNLILDGDSCITVTITNEQQSGNFNAQQAVIEGTANGGRFTVTPGILSAIAPNGKLPITVCFHPDDTGVVSYDTLIVTTECVTYRYPLIGNGITPLIYATDVDFGEVDSGKSRCMPVKLTNLGKAPLTITAQDLFSDPNFSVDPAQQFPITIAPGASVTIQYCFHPQSWGVFDTRVLFSNKNPLRFQHSVKDTSHLSGIAQPAGAKLTTYVKDFGLSDCKAKPIVFDTLYNDLPSDKEITSVKIIGPDAAFFTIVSNQPTYPHVLPGNGGSVPYEIQFDPMRNGLDFTPRVATLQVYTSDGQSQPAAKLNGVLTTPVVDFSVANLNVGSGKIGGQVTSTFTIRNLGNATLTVSGYGLTGADAAAYTLSPAAPFDIPAGGQQVVAVTVAGAESRDYSATVSVDAGCNAKQLPMTARFNSNGDVVLGTLHAKTYAGGCRSDVQQASFTNLSSADSITIVSVAIEARGGWNDVNDFVIQSPVVNKLVLPGSPTVNIPIVFTPSVSGTRAAALVFTLRGRGSDGQDSVWTEFVEVQGIGMLVDRTMAIGSITQRPNYSASPGNAFTAPIVVNTAVDAGSPDNGTTEAYGYQFSVTWNRDALRFDGMDAPNSSITIQELGTPFLDAATNLETHNFRAVSGSPISGLTSLGTLKYTSVVSQNGASPITLSAASWLDKSGDQLCYISDTTLSGDFAVHDECATKTLQGYLNDRGLTGLLGSIRPDPITSDHATADYAVATASNVTLELLDVMGNVRKTLTQNEARAAGAYSVDFRTTSLESGVYVLRLTDGRVVSSRRFVIRK